MIASTLLVFLFFSSTTDLEAEEGASGLSLSGLCSSPSVDVDVSDPKVGDESSMVDDDVVFDET